ncbi:hypothetical protein AB4Z52_31930 [Rhizobium sp. 2YAF20]
MRTDAMVPGVVGLERWWEKAGKIEKWRQIATILCRSLGRLG